MSATVEYQCANELVADYRFFDIAWQAVQNGRTYTNRLLQFGERWMVIEAVAIIRREYQLYQKELAGQARRAAIAARRQEERERPARQAIEEAYNRCDYRRAKQGHRLEIIMSLESSPQFVMNRSGTVNVAAAESRNERIGKYSSRCRFYKTGSVHTLYVHQNYLKRVEPLGTYSVIAKGRERLILDAEKVGYAVDGRPVYSIIYVRHFHGTEIRSEWAYFAIRPYAGYGASTIDHYRGEVLTKAKICRKLEIGRDIPDAPLVDMAIEKGLLNA